jgi:hypothetical protein
VAAAAAVLAGSLVLAVVWTRAHGGSSGGVAYGASNPASGLNPRQFLSYLWQFYFPKLSFMTPMVGPPYGWKTAWIQGFYGNFGSLEVLFPRWVYSDLRWASELGLFALALALVVRRAAVRRRLDALVLLVVTAVTLLLALHLAAYKNLLVNPSDPILVGRYLFPVVTLFGVAIACVASALPRRLGWAFAGVVVAAGVLLQLAGLGLTWTRFYA